VTTYDKEENGQESVFEKRPLTSLSPDLFIGMPVVVETEGAAFALCEAALVNWAGLYYKAKKDTDGHATLVASLAKLPPTAAATAGSAVIAMTPAQSPWRVVLVGDDADRRSLWRTLRRSARDARRTLLLRRNDRHSARCRARPRFSRRRGVVCPHLRGRSREDAV